MDKQELLKKLNFLNDKNKVAAKLYFHYNDGKGDILLEAPTNNDAVDKKIASIYVDSVQLKFNEDRTFHLSDITQVEEFDTVATYYYYKDKYPADLSFLFKEEKGKFSFKKHPYENIKGYLIDLTYGNDSILLYKYRHNFDIRISPTMLTLLRVDNELTSPSHESIIINEKFDYAIVDKYLVAMSLSTLERKLKFDERVNQQSKAVIQSIKDFERQIVEDYTKLEEYLMQNFNFAKKLKSIDFDGLLWKTPIADIKKQIDSRPKLNKYLKFNKKGDKFQITSKQAAKIFFKLCNDKVMESILSGNIHLVDEVESIDEE
ncbi:MAG: DUF4868 domain-containing protein [Ignavibacteriota bacterium]|nr:DUF4868 domain-containing protein [Ignavibacteriota bacterium]MCO6448902.1 DUF4868 domain-containing protein [Ignavibacterium album]MCZ2267848.1 DUF4868 domain-containing protein [Ignavibacteriales bacterium]QKK00950.1 MAG: DUF4868 domain-containing protein [Ignavibacteriota bacterium]HOJ07768.1 DUF4868 domain-containing protein [Ignavibacteriaceae bacterium]